MGIKNYLIDGVSCAGKTTVCDELQRRGYHAIHGDEELASGVLPPDLKTSGEDRQAKENPLRDYNMRQKKAFPRTQS